MTKINPSLFDGSGESVRQAFGDCPECDSPLHILNSKKGKFQGCTAYPECKYSQPLQKQSSVVTLKVMEDSQCPECTAAMAVKKGRYGMFIGCTNFPDCHYILNKHVSISSEKPIKCPDCEEGQLKKRTNKTGKIFYSCDQYPKCKHLINDEPVAEPCPKCNATYLLKKVDGNNEVVMCGKQDCDYQQS